MADENLERITILLQARDRDFARAMDRNNKLIARVAKESARNTDTMTRRIDANLSKVGGSVLGFGKAFAAGIAGGIVATAFSGFNTNIAGMIKGIAQVGDEAKRSGLGIEAFQEWKFVADQNRIGVDQLVDGFKELNLRADEFIATGAGPAAEAFARLGLSGEELGEKLKDPSALMLEIIGRLEEMDTAAQIRIADEVFGGSAGERFVELLRQGEDGLRQTIDRAHEVGAVLDEEMITKADEIDRKFQELSDRIAASLKKGIWDGLNALGAGITIEPVTDEVAAMSDAVYQMVIALSAAESALTAAGQTNAAAVFEALRMEVAGAAVEFQKGALSGDDMATVLDSIQKQAVGMLDDLEAIDGLTFNGVIVELGKLSGALLAAARAGAAAAAGVAAVPGEKDDGRGFETGSAANYVRPAKDYDSKTDGPRPVAAPSTIDWDLPPESKSRGGGGRSPEEDFQRSLDRTAQQIASLEAEAAAFLVVAAAGDEYAWSVDFARKKAELLVAAQQAGKEITPELAAQIDNLARAYADAGDAAQQASDDLDRVRENAERGAEAMSDIFYSVISGASSAKEAVASLLAEMAKAFAQRAFAGLVSGGGGGGIFGAIGGLLGGARAGGGGVSAGVPYLVNENTPNSEVFVPSRSGGVLNVAQAKDALRGGAGTVDVRVHMDEGGNWRASVEQISGAVAARAVQGYDQALPRRVKQISGDARRV